MDDLRAFGIEIEFLGDPRELVQQLAYQGVPCFRTDYSHDVLSCWKIVSDRSLNTRRVDNRYHLDGCELVSPPMTRADLPVLRRVCTALAASSSYVDASCGLHVHLNAADLDVPDVKRLLIEYTSSQTAIDRLLPPSRRRGANPYCVSYNPGWLKTRLATARSLMDVSALLPDRYRCVNLQSFPRFGTIEFRQHPGTIEYVKIVSWIRLCQALVRSAVEARPLGRRVGAFLESLNLSLEDREFFLRRAVHFNPGVPARTLGVEF